MATQKENVKRQKINGYIIWILCFIGIGSLSWGYTASIIGTTLGQPSFIAYFDLDTRANATDLIASCNGVFQTGGVIGVLGLSYVADRWGRKWALATAAFLTIFSGAFLAGSVNIGEFIFFRFFAGASAYMMLAAVPIWMNEVVPVNLRGTLVDIHAIFILTGYSIQGWVGFGFYFWKDGGSKTWRPPLALQCLWPLILLGGLYWIPESPRWLIMNGRVEEARQILDRLHSDPSDPDNEFARAEFFQIQKQVAVDLTLDRSWLSFFRKPSYRKRALLAIGTTGFIQCSGVLVINNYGPTVYRNLGFGIVKQLLYPAAWLTMSIGTNAMAMLFIDRFPRNKYMGFGLLGCCVTLIIEAALVAEFVPSTNNSALQAAVAMLFIFQVFYGACLDGTQFVYLGELFPTHTRAKGVCLGVAMISFMNIIWLQAAPTAFKTIGWKFYLIFIITSFLGGLTLFFFFPDTKGRPLEEIAAIFGDVDDVAIYQRDIEIDHTTHELKIKGVNAVIEGIDDEKAGVHRETVDITPSQDASKV